MEMGGVGRGCCHFVDLIPPFCGTCTSMRHRNKCFYGAYRYMHHRKVGPTPHSMAHIALCATEI